MKATLEHGGVALYGAAMIVLEVLAKNGQGKGYDFSIPLTGKHGLTYWRRELRTKTEEQAGDILEQLADSGVIDRDALGSDMLSAPMLKSRLDEYSRRKPKDKETDR
jgi:hypothetical protein